MNAGFEPPNPNGAVHRNEAATAKRRQLRRRLVLGAIVVVAIAWGYALWYSVNRTSPERLATDDRQAVAAACDRAVERLRELDTAPEGEQNVTLLRNENEILSEMVREFDTVSPKEKDPREALSGWIDDWTALIGARRSFVDDLEPDGEARFRTPNIRTSSLKPITVRMTQYADEQRLPQCTIDALQADVVDRTRSYPLPDE